MSLPSVASLHACFLAWACQAAEQQQRRAELSRPLPRLRLRLRRAAWTAWAQHTGWQAEKRRRVFTAECYRRLSTLQRSVRGWRAVCQRAAVRISRLETASRQRRIRYLQKRHGSTYRHRVSTAVTAALHLHCWATAFTSPAQLDGMFFIFAPAACTR